MRNKVKSLLFFLLFFSCVIFSIPQQISAQQGNIDDVTRGVTKQTLDTLNPLNIGNSGATGVNPSDLTTPGGIISQILTFAFPIAGMILFVMLIWGGFETLAGSATKKSMDAGRQRITAALIGFILLFISFWIMQIIEIVFGVKIFY